MMIEMKAKYVDEKSEEKEKTCNFITRSNAIDSFSRFCFLSVS